MMVHLQYAGAFFILFKNCHFINIRQLKMNGEQLSEIQEKERYKLYRSQTDSLSYQEEKMSTKQTREEITIRKTMMYKRGAEMIKALENCPKEDW